MILVYVTSKIANILSMQARLILFVLFTLLNSWGIFAQTKSFKIRIMPQVNGGSLCLDTCIFQINNKDSIQISKLKFYISKLELLRKGAIVYQEQNSFHLIDIEEKQSNIVALFIPSNLDFDAFKFTLGIDSVTNVSGAMGGDLDPTKGMYWTWQSGYINVKIEGFNLTGKKDFVYHLGGYLAPFQSSQTAVFPIADKTISELNLDLDLNRFFSEVSIAKTNRMMSPSFDAVLLAELFANCFKVVHK
jgi:hypothetical protein